MAASVSNATLLDLRTERDAVERELAALLQPSAEGDCGPVHEAMSYATLGGGKRLRPLLSLHIAQMLGNTRSPFTLRAAAAVELFHCASLIIDDLPCMDNEMERRGRATVHIAFNESTAVLAAFGLVALGGRCVLDLPLATAQLPPVLDFQKRLLRTLDCAGLIAGQARDLTLSDATAVAQRSELRAEVNEMKTVPLFELAVEAGMLGVDLTEEDRARLRLFGREFGRAFQLVDDLLDGHVAHRQPFVQHLTASRQLLSPFGEGSDRIVVLLDYLNAYADQKNHCHR